MPDRPLDYAKALPLGNAGPASRLAGAGPVGYDADMGGPPRRPPEPTLMATDLTTRSDPTYPSSDGRPMAETELHRDVTVDLIDVLQFRYADDPDVYVSGDMLVFYEEGDRLKHLAPDVFVALGCPKLPKRDHFLMWIEGKAPDLVVEITSKSTRREDQGKKLRLYRTALRVPEYFQFDPTEDYLRPPLQGFRLVGDEYVPIEPVEGRLPSEVLGLHFERRGPELHLYDPATGGYLIPSRLRAEAEFERAEAERERAEAERARADRAVADMEALRRELEALLRAVKDGNDAEPTA